MSFADFQAQARVDATDEQEQVELYIAASRLQAENDCRRAFITQTFALTLDGFPRCGEVLYLPRNPVQEVSGITYLDANGDQQTLATTVYQVDTSSLVARVGLKHGKSWPTIQCGTWNAVTITFVAGYGSQAADVPAGLRAAIAMLAAHWFEHREPIVVGAIVAKIPFHFERVLMQYKIPEAT